MRKTTRSAPDTRLRGFTLIEVLIALTVIAVALSAIIRTTGVMTRNTIHLKEKTHAHWIAMNRMNELRATVTWPSTGTTRERVTLFGQEWEWIQTVSKTEIDTFRRVDLKVIRAHDNEDQPVSVLVGFLLEPSVLSQQSIPTIPGPGNPQDPNDPNSPSLDDGIDGSEPP